MMKKFFVFLVLFVAISTSAQAGITSKKEAIEADRARQAAELQREKDKLAALEESNKKQEENNKLIQDLIKENAELNKKFDALLESNNQQNDLIIELLRRTE